MRQLRAKYRGFYVYHDMDTHTYEIYQNNEFYCSVLAFENEHDRQFIDKQFIYDLIDEIINQEYEEKGKGENKNGKSKQ